MIRSISFLSLIVLFLHSANGQPLAPRLVGEAHYTINNAPYPYADSLHYTYSGHRGGDLNHTIKSDTNSTYLFNILASGARTSPGFLSGMYVNAYDTNDNIISQEGIFFNGSTSSFQPYSLSGYTYDSKKNLLIENGQLWDTSSNKWLNASKQVYDYDGTGNLLNQVGQIWDPVGGMWMNNAADTFSYDAGGKVISHIMHYWGPSWKKSTQYLYTYDPKGNNIVELLQLWQMGGWVNYAMLVSTYSSTNDKKLEIEMMWDNTTSIWDTLFKDVYSYDVSHYMLTDLNQYWKGGAWHDASLNNYSYDISHNQILDTVQTRNSATGTLIYAKRVRSAYNSFNQLLTEITENWDGSGWGSSGTGGYEDDYTYESIPTAVTAPVNAIDNLSLYPVPARNTLHITIKWNDPQPFTISVFDIQGRLLQQTSHAGTHNAQIALPVSQLPAGSYFIKVNTANGVMAKEFTIGR